MFDPVQPCIIERTRLYEQSRVTIERPLVYLR